MNITQEKNFDNIKNPNLGYSITTLRRLNATQEIMRKSNARAPKHLEGFSSREVMLGNACKAIKTNIECIRDGAFGLENSDSLVVLWLANAILYSLSVFSFGHKIDGRRWIEQSQKEISERIDRSERTVWGSMKRLEQRGIIVKERQNDNHYGAHYKDQTMSYTFSDEFIQQILKDFPVQSPLRSFGNYNNTEKNIYDRAMLEPIDTSSAHDIPDPVILRDEYNPLRDKGYNNIFNNKYNKLYIYNNISDSPRNSYEDEEKREPLPVVDAIKKLRVEFRPSSLLQSERDRLSGSVDSRQNILKKPTLWSPNFEDEAVSSGDLLAKGSTLLEMERERFSKGVDFSFDSDNFSSDTEIKLGETLDENAVQAKRIGTLSYGEEQHRRTKEKYEYRKAGDDFYSAKRNIDPLPYTPDDEFKIRKEVSDHFDSLDEDETSTSIRKELVKKIGACKYRHYLTKFTMTTAEVRELGDGEKHIFLKITKAKNNFVIDQAIKLFQEYMNNVSLYVADDCDFNSWPRTSS